jgi:hypothetical protein
MSIVSEYLDEHKEVLLRDNLGSNKLWLVNEHMRKFIVDRAEAFANCIGDTRCVAISIRARGRDDRAIQMRGEHTHLWVPSFLIGILGILFASPARGDFGDAHSEVVGILRFRYYCWRQQ